MDGPWTTLASGLADTGSWDWTLPLVASDSAMVRVSAWDPSQSMGSDVSDSLFRVRDPNVGVGDARGRVFALAVPAPNPARDGTRLRFSLATAGHARLEVLEGLKEGERVVLDPGDLQGGARLTVIEGAR